MARDEVNRWLAREVGILLAVLLALVSLVGSLAPVRALFVGVVAYASTLVGGAVPDADVESGMDATYSSSVARYLVALGRFLVAVVALLAVLALDSEAPVVAGGLAGAVVATVALGLVRALPDLLRQYVPRYGLPVELLFWTLASLGGMVAARLALRALGAAPFAVQYLPPAVGVPVFVGVVVHVPLRAGRAAVRRYAPVPVERRVLRLELRPAGATVRDRVPLLVRFAFDRKVGLGARGIVLLAVAAPVVAFVAVWLALYYLVFVPAVG